ncbi:MAG: DUF1624 domain-containing protein [Opitutaceae bacterium]
MSEAPTPTGPPQGKAKGRLDSVDALRGAVMALMALDHARDFFHSGALHGVNPLDPATTTPALFLTRWITHFCAPVFVLLAGAGAYLSLARGRPKAELSRFLLTRGAWLIVLEMTFVQWAGWAWRIDLKVHFALVLWAIGWSMIGLAALIHLPRLGVAVIGAALCAGHNAFDGVKAADLGAFGPLWVVLHEGGEVALGGGHRLLAGYPLVPWVGVMAIGYALGSWLILPPPERRRRLVFAGTGMIVAFLALRATGVYGDPNPWKPGESALGTGYNFLSCAKYPPSLCYLLMTLGPALLLAAAWDTRRPAWTAPLVTFGRVPMFFYLLHLPLLHSLSLVVSNALWGQAAWLFGFPGELAPPHVGTGLTGVYLAWLLSLALLLPTCTWFHKRKQRRHSPLLTYL